MLVFRTHFDVEYKNYLELWGACDASYDLASQALALYQLSPADEQARKEGETDAISDFDKCREALADVRRRRPFIQQNVCDAAVNLLRECTIIRQEYMRLYDHMHKDNSIDLREIIKDTKERLETVRADYDGVARLIADRVQRMYVVD